MQHINSSYRDGDVEYEVQNEDLLLKRMLKLNPNDPGDTPYKIKRAVKESGPSLQQICDRMKSDYGVEITPCAISHSNSRGTL